MTLLFQPRRTEIKLEEQHRQRVLPRISFRACERFQRQYDSEQPIAIGTTTSPIPGFITQAFLGVVTAGLSLLIIGLMSGFRGGSSSKSEQLILMVWLAVGTVAGILVPFLNINDASALLIGMALERGGRNEVRSIRFVLVLHSLKMIMLFIMFIQWTAFFWPIWGFVVVGRQLREWGTCVAIY